MLPILPRGGRVAKDFLYSPLSPLRSDYAFPAKSECLDHSKYMQQ